MSLFSMRWAAADAQSRTVKACDVYARHLVACLFAASGPSAHAPSLHHRQVVEITYQYY